MNQATTEQRLRDLMRLFDALTALHQELFRVIDRKIEGFRRADVAAIQAAGHVEQDLLATLRERNGLRSQLMAALGREVGLTLSPGMVSVSKIAARLSAAQRGLLSQAAARLQAALAKTAQANRLAGAVAREVLHHMKWVFAAIHPRGGQAGYTGVGETLVRQEAVLIEVLA